MNKAKWAETAHSVEAGARNSIEGRCVFAETAIEVVEKSKETIESLYVELHTIIPRWLR